MLHDNFFDMKAYCNIESIKMTLQVAIATTTEKAATEDIQSYILTTFEDFMLYFHGKQFPAEHCVYSGQIGKNRGKNTLSIDGLYSISRIDFEYTFEVFRGRP